MPRREKGQRCDGCECWMRYPDGPADWLGYCAVRVDSHGSDLTTACHDWCGKFEPKEETANETL